MACLAKMETAFNRDDGEDWECELPSGHSGSHSSTWIEGTKTNGRWNYPVYDCAIRWSELTGLIPESD